MITFAAIAAAGDVNVNAIAPGIAAALLATVAGLSVAIPSLFGYNYLASRIKNISLGHADLHRRVRHPRGRDVRRALERTRDSMSAETKDDNQPYDEINVTPMLDLAYVLLVVFIILTTASVQGVKVNSPMTDAANNLGRPQTRPITITADGAMYLDAYPVTMEQLRASLAQYKSANPALPVVLKADARGAVRQGDGGARGRQAAGHHRDRPGHQARDSMTGKRDHASQHRRQAVRQHQRHADARSGLRAAGRVHPDDDGHRSRASTSRCPSRRTSPPPSSTS